MISKKSFNADGATTRFLSDFIIRNEQYARPYVFIYDNTLPADGTGDVLEDGTTDQSNWNYPDNLWKRGRQTPDSNDLVPVDKWQVVDNSILFYDAPKLGSTVYLEVATTSTEFGDTLVAPSLSAALEAETNAANSASQAATSASQAASSASHVDTVLASTYLKEQLDGSIGRLTSPLLDLPLKNSLSMKAGAGVVTFTRSTTATYIDRYGVLKTAAVDEPRFEKDGLLLEGTSTNLTLYSEDSTNWTIVGATLTANSIVSPDNINTTGTLGVVTSDGDLGVVSAKPYSTSGDVVGDRYSCSVFVKKYNHSIITFNCYKSGQVEANVDFNFDTGLAYDNTVKVKKLANGWFRLEYTIEIEAGDEADNSINNRIWVSSRSADKVAGNGCYMMGWQIEKLPFASSYIPTVDAAVTRAADDLIIPYNNNIDSLYSDKTYSVDFTPLGRNSISNMVLFETFYYAYNLARINISETKVVIYSAAAAIVGGNIDYSRKNNLTIEYTEDSRLKVFSDGVKGNEVAFTYHTPTASNTDIHLGSRINGTDRYYGHITNFKIFDFLLTDTEVSLLAGGTV